MRYAIDHDPRPAFGPRGFAWRILALIAAGALAVWLLAGCAAMKPLLPATGADLDKAAETLDARSKERTDRLRADVSDAEETRKGAFEKAIATDPNDVVGAVAASMGATLVRLGEKKVESDKTETDKPLPPPSKDSQWSGIVNSGLGTLVELLIGTGALGGFGVILRRWMKSIAKKTTNEGLADYDEADEGVAFTKSGEKVRVAPAAPKV